MQAMSPHLFYNILGYGATPVDSVNFGAKL
jgi:hypothetical protein